MNAKQICEALNIYTNGNHKYADIDAQAVYDNCINADSGSHTFEEADAFKKFVGIDKDTTLDELTALRNTLVRFWADDVHNRYGTEEEKDRHFKYGDQMQFYTSVIDMMYDAKSKEQDNLQESYDAEIKQSTISSVVLDDICGLVDFDEDGNPYIYYKDFVEYVDYNMEQDPEMVDKVEADFGENFNKLYDGVITTLTIIQDTDTPIQESLKNYKEVGKIIQNKENGGFNVAEKDEPMLVKDKPSLKTLLNDLAQYL